jgi:phosphoribosylformylglycinamidine synthase
MSNPDRVRRTPIFFKEAEGRMNPVKAVSITGHGTNCEAESAYAAKTAGADVSDIVYFFDLAAGRARLADYNFLIFPGGFLDGDDLGAGQAAAIRWRYAKTAAGDALLDQLTGFFQAGGIILGICNGFQLLVKLGLLPALGGRYFERQVSLANNDSARFEDRWVTLRANPASPCVFTKNVGVIDLPVRHGEGKLVPGSPEIFNEIISGNLHALQYVDPDTKNPTQDYPANPNGSPLAIAGLTDPTGRILGLMPHPEAYNDKTNHPGWTRGQGTELGLTLLENGVRYLKER